jgi:hypothetical protein
MEGLTDASGNPVSQNSLNIALSKTGVPSALQEGPNLPEKNETNIKEGLTPLEKELGETLQELPDKMLEMFKDLFNVKKKTSPFGELFESIFSIEEKTGPLKTFLEETQETLENFIPKGGLSFNDSVEKTSTSFSTSMTGIMGLMNSLGQKLNPSIIAGSLKETTASFSTSMTGIMNTLGQKLNPALIAGSLKESIASFSITISDNITGLGQKFKDGFEISQEKTIESLNKIFPKGGLDFAPLTTSISGSITELGQKLNPAIITGSIKETAASFSTSMMGIMNALGQKLNPAIITGSIKETAASFSTSMMGIMNALGQKIEAGLKTPKQKPQLELPLPENLFKNITKIFDLKDKSSPFGNFIGKTQEVVSKIIPKGGGINPVSKSGNFSVSGILPGMTGENIDAKLKPTTNDLLKLDGKDALGYLLLYWKLDEIHQGLKAKKGEKSSSGDDGSAGLGGLGVVGKIFKTLAAGAGGILAFAGALLIFTGALVLFQLVSWSDALIGMGMFAAFIGGAYFLAKGLEEAKAEKTFIQFGLVALLLSGSFLVFSVALIVASKVGLQAVAAIPTLALFAGFIWGAKILAEQMKASLKDFMFFAIGAAILSASIMVFSLSLIVAAATLPFVLKALPVLGLFALALQTIWWKRGKSGTVEAWKLQRASFMRIL